MRGQGTFIESEGHTRGLRPVAGTKAEREAAVLRLSPAGVREAGRSVQEPGYLRWTSRSPVKVEEQLVIRAQGTPAAITTLVSRFRQKVASALGCTTAADARGGK